MDVIPEAIKAYCQYLEVDVPELKSAGWTFPFDEKLDVSLSLSDGKTLLVKVPVNGRKVGENTEAGYERLLKVSMAIQDQVDTTIAYDADAAECIMYDRVDLENKTTPDVNEEIDTIVDDFEYVLDMLDRL